MAYTLSYAGIQLPLNTPEIQAIIDGWMPLEFARECLPIPTPWPGRTLAGAALPFWPNRPPIRMGQLWYPSGASRWAEFHFVADSKTVDAIQALALPLSTQSMSVSLGQQGSTTTTTFTGQAPTAQKLVIQSDPSYQTDSASVGGVSTLMYLLPPIPLQIFGSSPNLQGLWLVTLVDARYLSQYRDAGILHPSAGTSWTSVITQLTTALGMTLNPALPSIPSAYGSVAEDSIFWSNYESASILLDAAAANVGMSVVRNLDGTYQLMSFATSVTNAQSNRTSPNLNVAGGDAGIIDYSTQASSPASVYNNIIPTSINVTFPKFQINGTYFDGRDSRDRWTPSYGDVFVENVTVASISAFSSYAGNGNTKTLHDTCRAYYVNLTDANPQNTTDLTTLATQLATDYYTYHLTGINEVYHGIRNWKPEGLYDVVWQYGIDEATTRAIRKPWNWEITEFQHEVTNNPGASPCNCAQIVIINQPAPDANGFIDATIQTYNTSSKTWVNGAKVYLIDANNS